MDLSTFDEGFGIFMNLDVIKEKLAWAGNDKDRQEIVYRFVYFAAGRLVKEGSTWYVLSKDENIKTEVGLFAEGLEALLGQTNIKGALESAASKAEMDAVMNYVYFVAGKMVKEGGIWYVYSKDENLKMDLATFDEG